MEVWGWLVAYVVGFGLVQLLLYRYFQRDDPSPDATPGSTDQSGHRAVERSPHPPEDDEGIDGVQCPHCGAVNERDEMFTYCGACARSLR